MTESFSQASQFSLDDLQHIGFGHSEPLVCLLKQFLGDRQVNQRRVDIAMTEVRCQVSQTSLRVDSLLVPLRHSMNDECVSKIVDARATAAGVSVHASKADDPPEQLTPLSRVRSLLSSGKTEQLPDLWHAPALARKIK